MKRLWETSTNYGYMDRLRDARVLTDAVAAGLRYHGFFGYATGVSADGRLEGLHLDDGGPAQILLDGQSVLVPPDQAESQLNADARERERQERDRLRVYEADVKPERDGDRRVIRELVDAGETGAAAPPIVAPRKVMRRFHGAVDVNLTCPPVWST